MVQARKSCTRWYSALFLVTSRYLAFRRGSTPSLKVLAKMTFGAGTPRLKLSPFASATSRSSHDSGAE